LIRKALSIVLYEVIRGRIVILVMIIDIEVVSDFIDIVISKSAKKSRFRNLNIWQQGVPRVACLSEVMAF